MNIKSISGQAIKTQNLDANFKASLINFEDKYGRSRADTESAIRDALINRDVSAEKTYRGFCSDSARKTIEDKYNGNPDLTEKDFNYLSSLFNGDTPPKEWYTKHTSEEIVDVGDRGGWRKKDTSTYTLSLDTFLTNLFN